MFRKGSSFCFLHDINIMCMLTYNSCGYEDTNIGHGVSPAASTILQMVCGRCLILLNELLVLIMCALAVNALSLLKRKMNLLKRFVIHKPIPHWEYAYLRVLSYSDTQIA